MHKNLDVWKLAVELVREVYSITRQFPREELYALTSQIRRSSVSVPSNIAEGAARNSRKEFIQFLHIALGSCAELETQLIIAEELGYCNTDDLLNKIERIRQMIFGLIRKHRGSGTVNRQP
ncbi:four helix bundle protein [Desulfothermus okinawensis JCM 13304]